VNVFSPGVTSSLFTIGNFGDRLAKVANAYGLQVTRLEFPGVRLADPAVVEARLQDIAPYRGVIGNT